MFLAPILLLTRIDFDADMLALERQMKVGRIGVGIRDLKSGRTWFYRRSELFPMQSVFKFPLGVAIMDAVEHRQLSLTKRIRVEGKDLSVPASAINEAFHGKPLWYTNEQLLSYAMGSSDNTAADLLLAQLGGPIEATKRLHKLGITHIRIDRPEHQLQIEYCGIPKFGPTLTNEDGFKAAMQKVPVAQRRAAFNAYMADRRDTATPIGIIDLLTQLDSGKILSASSRKWLNQTMTDSATGPHRLKAGLPTGTKLAHKTGTAWQVFGLCGAVNDVGIATLPNGRKLAIAVFVAGSSGTTDTREKLIADVARMAVKLTEKM